MSTKNKLPFQRIPPILRTICISAAVSLALMGIVGFLVWRQIKKNPELLSLLGASDIQAAVPVAYVLDKDVGIKLKPLTKIRFKTPYFDVTNVTNSDGFVDREHHLTGKNYRIAILGDSIVESYGVALENKFTTHIERLVPMKSGGKKAVEIMAFGVSGWGPVHEYGCLKKYVLKYHPNEVWFTFGPGNDFGDDTPLLNGPPIGPTFVYKDASEKELVDILFGYPDVPDLMHEARVKKYGKAVLDSIPSQWTFGLFPYHFSHEKNPIWEKITEQTYQTFQLIQKLASANGIKVRVIYRPSGYEYFDGDWKELKDESRKLLKRDLPMDQMLGEKRTREKLEKMGIGFITLRDLHIKAMLSPKDETELVKHYELGNTLSDIILKTVPEEKLLHQE